MLAASTLTLFATAWASEDGITQGGLRVLPKDDRQPAMELPLKHTDVQAEISGFISRVRVTQTFTNPSKDPIEAVYVFPLPQDAAVSDMQITIGDRVIKGLIKKRDEARQIYLQAKQAGKTAALLDQERPNIFAQSVANIMPGSEIRVEITYDDVLAYERGGYEFVFPMVVGPRYIPGAPAGKTGGGWSPDTDQVPDASRITPPVLKPGERNGHDISLTVRLETGVTVREIGSPSHKIDIQGQEIRLAANDVIPNKDFVLRYRPAGDDPEFAVLSHHAAGGNFFMLMFQPPAAPKPDTVTAKEMVFVMDCSGSMNGEPITLSKKAVRHALQNLNPDDTFQIIRFSEAASPFGDKPLPATPENVRRGLSYINGLSGEGGTRMIEGIKAALDYPHEQGKLRIVCFLTDGYIGNEGEILDAIERKIGEDTRLFSFGVGSSVNRYLLDAMAEVGRGEVAYVTLNEKPEEQVEKFYERVRNPYVTHIRVDWGGLEVKDLAPSRIRDLFIGSPLFLMGRYDRAAEGTIKIHAKVNGADTSYAVPVRLTESDGHNAALAALWARSRIKELGAEQYGGEKPAVVEQVTDLALAFRLMSPYTSFVAVEEKVVNEGGQTKTIQVPVEMPEGVSYEGVFGEADGFAMPAVAAPMKIVGFQAGAADRGRAYGGHWAKRVEAKAPAFIPPAESAYTALELDLSTDDGERIAISASGEVWRHKGEEHLFIARLTHEQTVKLIGLLHAAAKTPRTAVAHSKSGSLKFKLIGDTPIECVIQLTPDGEAAEAWGAVLKYLNYLAL
jgi:Ca-activated chloride channel family protein